MQTGLDVFLEEGHPQLFHKRVGLITNPTGVDCSLRSNIDLLSADRRIELRALFGPEHGIRGDAQAGVKVERTLDQKTGLPAYSLYGQTRRPTAEMLEGLEALIFDLQDLGARYSTYPGTLYYVQEAAAQANIPLVVFDRPNPIAGNGLAGNILDPNFTSFVGIHPLPICHTMTVGELARLFAAESQWPEPLVVKMRGWYRKHWYDETGLPFVQPSPNLPTLDALTLYPGTCLLEGTTCSEGRGTTRPFELIGAPDLDPFELAEQLNRRNLPGVALRPAFFTPVFSKHAQALCGGVQVHIIDRQSVKAVELGLHLLSILRQLLSEKFEWVQATNGKYFIDLLFGSDTLRQALDAEIEVNEIIMNWDTQLADFHERRRPFLLYDEESD